MADTVPTPLVSINLVYHREAEFFSRFRKSIDAQTYPHIEVNILDTHTDNIGFWAGQEKLLAQSSGEYVIAMSDVLLDKYFVSRAIAAMEQNKKIGALQAKILQGDHTTIDTTGFEIAKSRRITNRGQGMIDTNQYDAGEIFAVEGAVPVFRKQALEDCRTDEGWLIDPDYRIGPFGYGDDLDLTWRMRNRGWKQWYDPGVIAYHDRSTTSGLATGVRSLISRRKIRKSIPLIKRQLDWRNVRFTIIKNDSILALAKDAPFWLFREIGVITYSILFEPGVLLMIPSFISLLPRMLSRRRQLRKPRL